MNIGKRGAAPDMWTVSRVGRPGWRRDTTRGTAVSGRSSVILASDWDYV